MPDPRVGQPLPRAKDAYTSEKKWSDWILATPGHGADWRRVFGAITWNDAWDAVLMGIELAPISDVRILGEVGVSCGVDLSLIINGRAATVRTAWHYVSPDAAPRLVTAYPTT